MRSALASPSYMRCSVAWILLPQVSEIGSAKVDIGGKLCPHGCLMLLLLCNFHRELVTRCDKQFRQRWYF